MIRQTSAQLLNILEDKIKDDEVSFLLDSSDFNKTMLKSSCKTLKNIHYIIDEYLNSISKESTPGENILFVFGLLQGLFVSIDALYSLGKSITMDKLIININSNDKLRDIKHIRNDVVGHPTYRFYQEDVIGFCVLDIDHITKTNIKYYIYTFDKGILEVNEKEVDLLEVIDSYYFEANKILKQAISFLDIFDEVDIVSLIDKVILLFYRFNNGNKDYDLLNEIKEDYIKIFNISDDDSSRFLWRIDLINILFNYKYLPEEEKYIKFLTFSEIKKVYHLIYNTLKNFKTKKKYRNLNYEIPNDFKILYESIRENPKIKDNIDILHDYKHPLYSPTIKEIIKTYQSNEKLSFLIQWINNLFISKEYNMLYLIGSQLKKN